MAELSFKWDPRKAATNRRKHGVSFEEAATVFSDDRALVIGDPDHSEAEDRFVLLGVSATLRVLVVVHCYREGDARIRLISARKATRSERAQYDAAICLYHDQALIPLKTLYFDQGVNTTLGLPIVRTAPDHGTAFAIAGQDKAHPGAMISAIRLAGDAVTQRKVECCPA